MNNWYVSTPVWGDFFRKVFVERAVPSYLAALILDNVGAEQVKWIIHTDQPGFADRDLHGYPVTYIQTFPGAAFYDEYRECHLSVLRDFAKPGDWVSLLNADFIVSNNFFVRIREHLSGNHKAVAALGMRTLLDEHLPPTSADPRTLLSWGWSHKHEETRESVWGSGHFWPPTIVFFEEGDSVVARSFQIHPVAIVKDYPIEIVTSADGETLENFPFETIHVVSDPDDLAFIEMSPFGKCGPIDEDLLSIGAVVGLMHSHYMRAPLYRWQFGHRIVIKGDGAHVGDTQIAKAILDAPFHPVRRSAVRRWVKKAVSRWGWRAHG